MNNGWIKLHRKLTDWEWWDDHNTTRLFVFILISANHKDKKWRGTLIRKGQLLTSRDKLSDCTGLTVQQVRSSLEKLKSTSEITIKTSSRNTVIELKNYKEYQANNQQDNQQITNKQPADNQQITTTKKAKNEKKDKKNTIDCDEVLNKLSSPIRKEVVQVWYKHGFKPSADTVATLDGWFDALFEKHNLKAKDLSFIRRKLFEFDTWASTKRPKNHKMSFNNFLTKKSWEQ